jgi:acyl-CoA dehydrogenase
LPIVYSAYVGIAEKAKEIALGLAARKKEDPLVQLLAGELENQVVAAQVALESMLALAASEKPSYATSSAVCTRRTLLVNAVLRVAEKAMELAGGAGFFRAAGLELCVRDLQAARFHPMPEKAQTRLTGRFVLGMELG